MDRITARALQASDWETFKDFRLKALAAAPGVFASSYQEEVGQTAHEWQTTARGPFHQVFGLFDSERLVAITAAFPFILPEYRGRGLSRLLYQVRLDWILRQTQFQRVVVSHRESNAASRRAIERHGFTETHRAARIWPDGTSGDEIFYEHPFLH